MATKLKTKTFRRIQVGISKEIELINTENNENAPQNDSALIQEVEKNNIETNQSIQESRVIVQETEVSNDIGFIDNDVVEYLAYSSCLWMRN